MAAGSQKNLQVVVADVEADVEAIQRDLRSRGVETSEIQDYPWGRFIYFSDPDGNSWAVQEIPPRS